MSLALLLLLLAGGFVILLLTADLLVRGAAGLALKSGLPRLFVGITIVAFGTSAPELVVAVDAVRTGAPDAALGAIVGSNIANVLLVLGAPALVCGAIAVTTPGLRRNAVATMGAVIALIALSMDGALTFIDGAILFGLMVAYLAWMYVQARRPGAKDPIVADLTEELEGDEKLSGKAIALMIAGGLIGLPISAAMIVRSAVALGESFGVPTHIIGLTVLALGTSLPELAAGIAAAARGHGEVTIGNVLGSNLFNALGVMGIAGMVGVIPVPDQMLGVDLWLMGAAMLGLNLLIFLRRPVGRLIGAVLILTYGAYIVWLGGAAGF